MRIIEPAAKLDDENTETMDRQLAKITNNDNT